VHTSHITLTKYALDKFQETKKSFNSVTKPRRCEYCLEYQSRKSSWRTERHHFCCTPAIPASRWPPFPSLNIHTSLGYHTTHPTTHLLPTADRLRILLQLGKNLLSLGAGSINVTNPISISNEKKGEKGENAHIKSSFGEIVTLSVHDGLEGTNGVLQVDQDTLDTCDIN